MSYLRGEDGSRTQLFPRGELDSYLDAKKLVKLGEIPFHPSVGVASEAGIPVVLGNPSSAEAAAFKACADNIVRGLSPA
jgi:ATP-binding protein involved in chromosome partitioning